MPFVEEAFGTLGETVALPGRTISRDDVQDADLLAIRSTTKVDADLLDGTPVKFVGTATIGINHMDIDYLESHDIAWCGSPGCNANSVSEYITANLLYLAEKHDFQLAGKTIGVIGVGNVGCCVVQKARALGLNVLPNDPPRQDAEPGGTFASLDQVLAESDIITMHVPLTKDGKYPTYQMANEDFFSRMKPGVLFINSSRGKAMQTDPLLAAIKSGRIAHCVIDTWENEPGFRKDLLDAIDIATPHIAGHSFEGKVNGTVMVYQEACRVLGVEQTWSADELMPGTPVPEIYLDCAGKTDQALLWEAVQKLYDPRDDDRRLGSGADGDAEQRAKLFDELRSNYWMRREFQWTEVVLDEPRAALDKALRGLGFKVS
jgi:erythronate-4-phosphate dehydrogenase